MAGECGLMHINVDYKNGIIEIIYKRAFNMDEHHNIAKAMQWMFTPELFCPKCRNNTDFWSEQQYLGDGIFIVLTITCAKCGEKLQ